MIGVLTHHWAKDDKIAEAKKLLDGNGLAQSKAPLCLTWVQAPVRRKPDKDVRQIKMSARSNNDSSALSSISLSPASSRRRVWRRTA